MTRGLPAAMMCAAAWCCALMPDALAEEFRAPAITAIFPSGKEVPANHLKFYIHFSEPMRQGVFLQHCALLDERRQPVFEPFRETELWSEDRKRLTLWLHPGRQKTGVNLNEEFGPILRTNASYALVISGRWPSDTGVPLGKDVEKSFRAKERASGQLHAATWQVTPGPSGTTKPLEVYFPAPMDHALLQRCLRVVDMEGRAMEGTGATADHEQRWTFTPSRPWSDKLHHVLADPVLEDLAGNSLARPFEVDLDAPAPKRIRSAVEIPFRPRTAPGSK